MSVQQALANHAELGHAVQTLAKEMENDFKYGESSLIDDCLAISQYMGVMATCDLRIVLPFTSSLIMIGTHMAAHQFSSTDDPPTEREQLAIDRLRFGYAELITKYEPCTIGPANRAEWTLLPLSLVMGALRCEHSQRTQIEIRRIFLALFILKATRHAKLTLPNVKNATPLGRTLAGLQFEKRFS
jgi:hypothetical protein